MGETLVACKWCGAVFIKRSAVEQTWCPSCDTTGDVESVPRHGKVHKWWSEVDDD